MKFLKENWHWGVTILWIGFVGYLWQFSGIEPPKELNSIGDFLAGAFAPLAFFWLVRGFYQQGEGLKQNSEALALQADELRASSQALALQAKEMKATVEQQKLMAEYQRMEIEEKHQAVKPLIRLNISFSSDYNANKVIIFTINFHNNHVPSSIKIYTNLSDMSKDHVPYSQDYANSSKDFVEFFDLFTEVEEKIWEQQGSFTRYVQIIYTNMYGREYHNNYTLDISNIGYKSHASIKQTG